MMERGHFQICSKQAKVCQKAKECHILFFCPDNSLAEQCKFQHFMMTLNYKNHSGHHYSKGLHHQNLAPFQYTDRHIKALLFYEHLLKPWVNRYIGKARVQLARVPSKIQKWSEGLETLTQVGSGDKDHYVKIWSISVRIFGARNQFRLQG